MQESDRVNDEYTLAAFLAGTLSEGRRREVVEYLAANPEAREVLQMAVDALDAARSATPEQNHPSMLRPPFMRLETRAPRPRTRSSRLHGAGRYVAATFVVFVIGVVLRLTIEPPTDAFRSPLERTGAQLQVEVSAPGSNLSWTPVEKAYRYHLVVWNPREARVVGQYETEDRRLHADHPVMQELRHDLERGRSYTVRIDAVDAQNRLIRSSDTVELSFD